MLSVQEFQEKQNRIDIWPNPGNGEFTLQLPYFIDGKAKLYLVDIAGRSRQFDAMSFGGVIQVDFRKEGLASGMYAIRAELAGKSYFAKLIIQP